MKINKDRAILKCMVIVFILFTCCKKVNEMQVVNAAEIISNNTISMNDILLDKAGQTKAIEDSEGITRFTNQIGNRTKEEVAKEYEKAILRYTGSMYEESPTLSPVLYEGKLKQELIDETMKQINFFRYLYTNVKDSCSYIPERMIYNQKGALLLATSNFSHYPDKPSFMDDQFYSDAIQGTGSGEYENTIYGANCSWGTELASSIVEYVDDSTNVYPGVGHRLSVLSPYNTKTSFGACGAYNCVSMYNAGAKRDVELFYTWPSAGYFPREAFNMYTNWSVQFSSIPESLHFEKVEITYEDKTYDAADFAVIDGALLFMLSDNLCNILSKDLTKKEKTKKGLELNILITANGLENEGKVYEYEYSTIVYDAKEYAVSPIVNAMLRFKIIQAGIGVTKEEIQATLPANTTTYVRLETGKIYEIPVKEYDIKQWDANIPNNSIIVPVYDDLSQYSLINKEEFPTDLSVEVAQTEFCIKSDKTSYEQSEEVILEGYMAGSSNGSSYNYQWYFEDMQGNIQKLSGETAYRLSIEHFMTENVGKYFVTYRSKVSDPSYMISSPISLTMSEKKNQTEEQAENISVKKGTKFSDTTYGKFTVTSADTKNPTVAYTGTTNKKKKTITIPDTTTYEGVKYAVTSISAKAFKGNKKLTTVKIGSNVTKIDNSAFEGCTSLKTVTIGKGLKTIGKNVFKNCKKLKNLTIKSSNLKTVGKNALKGIHAKCKIKVPSKKVNAYKKLFNGKGQKKTVRITK